MPRRLVPLAAAISLLLAPQVHALGLGAIEVRSTLDEPLLAEIQLVSVRPGELDELRVALASGNDFQRAGVTRVGMLSQLDFELAFRDGTPYIRVTTPRAIREPFLNFLVEANWNSGRMLREYTVLLDPPTFIAGDAPPMDTPATAAPQLVQRESAPARTPRASAAAPVDRPVRAATGALEYGPTRSRDTLWNIAEELRPDESVSVYQMMIALQRENPEAFDDANVNRLRAGHTLRIADLEAVAAVSHREAVADFREQTTAWREATRPAAQPEPSSGVLRLVAPDSDEARRAGGATSADTVGADTEAELVALRRELRLAQETAEAERRRNEELSARLEELADQVETVQRLLSLESQDMARLQALLSGQLDAQVSQPAEQARAETPPAEEAAAAEPAQPAEQVTPAAAPAERPARARAPEPEPVPPAWYEMVAINPLYAAGGAGLLLLGGAMWAVRRRRRGAQESILAPAAAGAAMEHAGGATTEETSFLSDFAVSGMGDIHAEDTEVDPVTEAGVYMDFGRYEQAEELLTEALAASPEREPLQAKLLEVYHATRNAEAFLTQAQAYYARHGEADAPNWPRIAGMGAELMPDEALFAGHKHSGGKAAAAAAGGGAASAAAGEVLDIGLDTADFDLDEFALEGSLEDTPEGGDDAGFADLDFGDLDVSADKPAKAAAPAKPAPAEAAAPDLDADLDFGGLDTVDALPELGQAESLAEDAGGLDQGLDMGTLDAGELDSIRAAQSTGADAGVEPDMPTLDFDPGEFGGLDTDEPVAAAPAVGDDDGHMMDFDGLGDMGIDLDEAPDATAEPAAAELEAEQFEGLEFAADDPTSGLDAQDELADVGAMPGEGEAAEDSFELTHSLDEVSTKLDLAQAYIDLGDPDGAREILQEVLDDGNERQQRQAEEIMQRIA